MNRQVSFVQIYSNALAKEICLSVSIAALAEVGSEQDTGKIIGFLASMSPNIRKLALIAASKLSLAVVAENILDYLKDPGPGVSNAARKVLTANRLYVDLIELEKIFLTTESEAVRTNCLKVLTTGNKWDSIYYIIKCRRKAADHEYCDRLLSLWNHEYNKSFIAPSSDQIQRIRPLLENSVNYNFDREIQMVKFAIRGFISPG